MVMDAPFAGRCTRNGQAGKRRRARLELWIGSPASSKFAGVVGRLLPRCTAGLRLAGLEVEPMVAQTRIDRGLLAAMSLTVPGSLANPFGGLLG
jgi:hypothetical protein